MTIMQGKYISTPPPISVAEMSIFASRGDIVPVYEEYTSILGKSVVY